jgi:deazaflavin-dependent oxidoreductase (nitroreductase family)
MNLHQLTKTSPRGLLLLSLRIPILLYKGHLGWIFGDRFLMLTHIGRKSVKEYQTVVEVVRHDQEKGIYTIASGWGVKADWYRNILVHPEVKVHVGKRQFTAIAMRLSENEAKIALRDYAAHHPHAFKELAAFIVGLDSSDTEELINAMSSHIPLLELRPKSYDTNSD